MSVCAQLCSGVPAKRGHQLYSLAFPNRDVRFSSPLALLTPAVVKLRADPRHLAAAGWRQDPSFPQALLTPREGREAACQLALPPPTPFCLTDAWLGERLSSSLGPTHTSEIVAGGIRCEEPHLPWPHKSRCCRGERRLSSRLDPSLASCSIPLNMQGRALGGRVIFLLLFSCSKADFERILLLGHPPPAPSARVAALSWGLFSPCPLVVLSWRPLSSPSGYMGGSRQPRKLVTISVPKSCVWCCVMFRVFWLLRGTTWEDWGYSNLEEAAVSSFRCCTVTLR